jgi:hypothetical protein
MPAYSNFQERPWRSVCFESECRNRLRLRRAEGSAGGRRPTAGRPGGDSAKEILELLELELGAMIRQLERAANSVAGGAEATAATLSTIRQRTDA